MNSEKIFSITINGSIEDVWTEITKTDAVQKAMFNMRLDANLAVGEPIRYRSPDGKYTGIIGEVISFDPMKTYGHTFKFTQYDEPACEVIHELEEVEGGVKYTMICRNMAPNTKTTKQMSQGGDFIIKNLKAIVENGKVPFTTAAMYALFKLMAPFTPKSMLSENYP